MQEFASQNSVGLCKINFHCTKIKQNCHYCSRTQMANDDLNVKTGWYHAKQDTIPHFLLKTKEEEKGGRVSSLAWYQPVLTFRSVVWRFGTQTVIIGLKSDSLNMLKVWSRSMVWFKRDHITSFGKILIPNNYWLLKKEMCPINKFPIPFNKNTTISAVLLGWNYVQVKVNSIVPQLSSKMYYHRKNNKDNQ